MKRRNIDAEAALRKVARKNHTTLEEVRKEIRLALIMTGIRWYHIICISIDALCSTDGYCT